MLAIPSPTTVTARTTDPALAVIRLDAEALEHAAHLGHLALSSALPAVLVESIAWAHHVTDALPGGLSGAVAADYEDAPGAFVTRWLDALWRSAQLHHATDRWPELTTGLAPRRCGRLGCPSTDLELYGRRWWCPGHVADELADALITETMGEGTDGA
jgi:hypothetical protein